jgi:PhnB protein
MEDSMSDVKAIPDGYHTITPNITVRDAAAALAFYQKALGAEELMRMPGPGGKILHAEIKIGNSRAFVTDEMPEMGGKSPKALGGSPVGFYLYVHNVDAAWKRAVDAGAKVINGLEDMFWGDRTGRLEDPFGHTWTLAQHVKDMTPAEMKAGQAAWEARMKKS